MSICGEQVEERDSRELRFVPKVFLTSVTVTLCSFNQGYNVGAPNNPEKVIRDCYEPTYSKNIPSCLPMSDLLWGFAIGVFCIGGLVGGTIAGPLADRYGRKWVIFWNNLSFLLGGVLMSLSVNTVMFACGRFLVGFGSGVGSVIVPLYITETSTTRNRGAMGSLVQMQIAVGIVLSQGISLALSYSPGWRILFGLTMLPAILQMFLMPFCPETPRHLVSKQHYQAAREALATLRPGHCTDMEFEEMLKAIQSHSSVNESLGSHVKRIWKQPQLRKMLCVGLVIHASQTLSCINGVTLYSTSIMTETTGVYAAQLITVGIAIFNFFINCATCVSIDRMGRRPFLIASTLLMVVFAITLVIGDKLTVNVLKILSVILFSASFNVGLASIPFIIVPELAPTWAAGVVVSLTTTMNWIGNFLVIFLFPTILSSLQSDTFILVAALNFIFLLHHCYFVPETKGISIDENAEDMARGIEVATKA
ncbi:monosaccharide transporter [Basidiobolus meristosporus CBS 931.73]|uniref:Monosaccharide transporter n=1 Tax=Basidiobolus meristosporus CBS 931.73 TaxID=1314790 RepID=A0A1Y1YMB6_9FUNG|nr:monosaccharide transporter [Basidiobolus meristosporus CBS 931.73]|eukprot:ORX99160.1 monosaccharide transporter [Basidiobolus meristosporus CBS 931.73]